MVTISVTAEEATKIARKLPNGPKSWGGFQRLLDTLHAGLKHDSEDHTYTITMSDHAAERVLMYSDAKYGHGTYQTVLRAIAPRVQEQVDNPPTQTDLELEDE